MSISSRLKSGWWVLLLVLIFAFSYYIRAQNIVPDRLLSYDPIFQYRYTYYVANSGHLPLWDELTYYVGRAVDIDTSPPFMLYVTTFIYWLIKSLGMSLLTVASYMSAIYGAMIVIPAFLLGRELSNKYGGLLSAVLVGTAPQILSRTFGSSYDNDQLVIFFLMLTLYLGYMALKKKTIFSYSLALVSLAGFLMMWNSSFYSFFILLGFTLVYFVIGSLVSKEGFKRSKIPENIKSALGELKLDIAMLVALLAGLTAFAAINAENIWTDITNVVSFATQASVWIVNISIAELQPFDVFSLQGWITAMGGFYSGVGVMDSLALLLFTILIVFGFYASYKKRDLRVFSFLVTLLAIGLYTTSSGIRFSEFTSTFFITLIAVGFGSLIAWLKGKDVLYLSIVVGLGILLAFYAFQLGQSTGKQLGPDVSSNWESAWTFLRTQTPEMSLVGTWWDPGHMITGIADRRVIADGAHCHDQCLYTINARIADLGLIMATTNESKSLELIRKYQGDSPNVYWIASDDLIGKFQWLQYFGLGCDARVEPSCPLYIELGEQSQSVDNSGNVVLRNYGSVSIFTGLGVPIPMYKENITGYLFDETLYYSNNTVVSLKFNDTQNQQLIQTLKPLETQMSFRFTNQTIPLSVWIPEDYSYIVIIPQNLRDSVFTKMFMLEGQGLTHFKEVFRNSQVKIFQVV